MATELATAYISLIPTLKGAGKSIAGQLGGVDVSPSGRKIGKSLGHGISAGLAADGGTANSIKGAIGSLAKVAGPALAAVGFGQLAAEAARAADATQKFKSTLDFAGLGASEIEALSASTRRYADQTVYSLSDIQGITAQLAANGVEGYDKLAEAAGNLNAVAGGNASTFSSVGLVLTQTAGAGKLTTENWNQLANAIPGASGKLQQAMLENGAYTGNFRKAMEQGQISAEEFNRAIMELGFEDAAVEAAKSTATFEGAIGNLQAAVVGGLSDVLTKVQPAITAAINGITPVVEAAFAGIGAAVQFVADNFDSIAPIVAAVAAAFGGLKIAGTIGAAFTALAGPVAMARKMLVAFRVASAIGGPVSALGTSVKLLGGVFASSLGGPVGIAIAVIAALGAALVVLWNTNEGFREAVTRAWDQMQALAMAVWPAIQRAVQVASAAIRAVVQAVGPVVQSVVTGVMTAIQAVVTTVLPVVQAAFQAAGGAIQAVVNTVFPLIQTVVTTAMNAISAVIGTVLALIRGDWEGVWSGIQAFASSVWEGIRSTVAAGIHAAKGAIASALNAIGGIWSGAWSALGGFLASAWSGFGQTVSGGVELVMGLIGALPERITGLFASAGSWLVGAGRSILNGLLDGLKSAWSGVTGFVGGIGDWIVSHKGPPSYDKVMLVKNGQLIMNGLLRGMTQGWGDVEDFIGSRNAGFSTLGDPGPMRSAAAVSSGRAAESADMLARAVALLERIAEKDPTIGIDRVSGAMALNSRITARGRGYAV